jgi:FKBP-type peptidyl-prolyl cis-trans isomerase
MRRLPLLGVVVLVSCTNRPAQVPRPDPTPSVAGPALAGAEADASVAATADEAPPDPPPAPSTMPAPADVAAPPADAIVEKSGLASRVLRRGNGVDRPGPSDQVEVHYTLWLADGQTVDGSVLRGTPSRFALGRVVDGLSQGIQLMSVGEKRRLWIPEALAYKGRLGAPAGTLIFDVELLSVRHWPQGIPPPPDVAAPPTNARREKSGLATLVLARGTGKRRPTAGDTVEVHYSGWTTDGRLFDSSIPRGRSAHFPLRGVLPGWAEGLQLMVEGEKRRLWIPADLAYAGRPGAPAGTLVFDVELIAIE